jgi:acyl-coenzyme A synthetase/AMP-(fatty) acid ligase
LKYLCLQSLLRPNWLDCLGVNNRFLEFNMPARIVTTYEHLQYWEVKSPDALAIVNYKHKVTYARFIKDVRRFTQAVAEFGVKHGDVVLVSCADVYIHWLLLLAVENVGAVSASVVIPSQPIPEKIFERATFVFTEEAPELLPGQKIQLISQQWVGDIMGRPTPDVTSLLHPIEPHDGSRLVSSSGTTGEPKVMLLTHAFQEERIRFNMDFSGLTRQSRMLLAAPYAINPSYTRMINCLRIGAMLMTGPLPEMIRRYQPTSTWMMPVQLETLLKDIPENFPKPANLDIICAGAALSAKLRERVLARLASRITCNFRTNESGAVFTVDSQGRCLLLPGVQAQVVDDNRKPLPLGELGLLGVRSALNIDGYLDNPKANETLIHEGWFYPGDMAVMMSPRTLRVMGRQDEVLNLGGVKIPPATVEEQVMAVEGVKEVAALSDAKPDTGVARLCLAIVAHPDADKKLILKLVPDVVNVPATQLIMRIVPSLPYTDNGKLKRKALRSLFENKI